MELIETSAEIVESKEGEGSEFVIELLTKENLQ